MNPDFNIQEKLGISREWLNSLFPFFIVLDEYLTVLEFGDLISKAVDDLEVNQGLDNYFEYLDDEEKEITFDSLVNLQLKSVKFVGKLMPLKLWGEVKVFPEEKLVIFLGTPNITALNQITRYKISLEDFPISDPTIDFVNYIDENGVGGGAGSKSKYAKDDDKKEKGFQVPGLDGSDIDVPKDYEVLKEVYKKMAYEFGKVARASTELQDIIRDKTQELDMQVVMTQEALKKAQAEQAKAVKAQKETEIALKGAEKSRNVAEKAELVALEEKGNAEKSRNEAENAKLVALKEKGKAEKSRNEAEKAELIALKEKGKAEEAKHEAMEAKALVEKASEDLKVAYKQVDGARAEARAEADEAIKDVLKLKDKAEEDATSLREKVRRILEVVKHATTGDLTKIIPVSGEDAIGQVGEGLNEFFNVLKSSIKEIESASLALGDASEELQDNNLVMKNNSNDTNHEAESAKVASLTVTNGMADVSSSMENMIEGIKDITQMTREASDLSTEAEDLATDTNEIITELDLSSTRIGKVIKLIEAIAHQTNLLSLNAQIEAMWAGDAGKGFRVVANEVKQLSKQTATATQEVEKMITNIQSDSKKAITAVSQISESIVTMNGLTKNISQSMLKQSSLSESVTGVVGNTSDSIKGINASIDRVETSANNTGDAIIKSQASAEDLGEWALNLKGLVEKFKIQ